MGAVSGIGREVSCTGSFEIPLEPGRAISLFTPEGERGWVDGWDPRYPVAGADDNEPGTVFLTPRPDGEVVWVVTAASEHSRAYARFDPRGLAATIEVGCEAAGDRGTRVEVRYRQTALDPRLASELEQFERGYDAYMSEWRAAIEAMIARGDLG